MQVVAIDNTFTCYTSQEIEILTGGHLLVG